MFKYGLKLWSTNENYLADAKKLYKKGIYNYVELYIIPGSYEKFIGIWKEFNVPYIIHAPHYENKLNLAKKECLETNIKMYEETRLFADDLKAKTIIFHPGIAGDIKETVNQLKTINDKRIAIENKPYNTILNDGQVCNGHSVEEIKYVIKNTGVGFCMDIGHAICAAVALKRKPYEYLREFLELGPTMYHLTDGDISSPLDSHKHIGYGNFDLAKIVSSIPDNAKITIETAKDNPHTLFDFQKDIENIININKNHE